MLEYLITSGRLPMLATSAFIALAMFGITLWVYAKQHNKLKDR